MFDTINGSFELFGMFFILPSIVSILRTKSATGISWVHAAFFWTWGLWNLVYYPSLDQWFSAVGAVGIFLANTVWLVLIIRYQGTSK